MNMLYDTKDGKLVYLNDLLEPQLKEVDLSILEKFLRKYSWKILTKEPLWLCNIENIYFFYPYTLGYGYPKTNIVKYFQIAKTGNKQYCEKIFNFVKDKVLNFAKKYDAVVFVPYSVKRQCNVLDYLKDYLKKNNVKIIESFQVREWNEIKNIKSLKDKFETALKKFDVNFNQDYKKILIIDDMVNTWASMCAIASKFPSNVHIDGLSIVGSLSNELVSDI